MRRYGRYILAVVLVGLAAWRGGVCISARRLHTSTELLRAVRTHDTRRARALLERGASPDLAEADDGRTALQFAVQYNDLELVALLISKGARTDRRERNGWTALHYAALFDRKDAALLLVRSGADESASDSRGQTPLHLAAACGSSNTALALLAVGADVDARTHGGRTALHMAAANARPELVRALLAHGADVNARDKDGHTPLGIALSKRGGRWLNAADLEKTARELRAAGGGQ
jgi:ankyrin repeat protein